MCECNDCTKCPYNYCVDEEKDNSNTNKIHLREYNNAYHEAHKNKINDRNRKRYKFKKEHGICIRCSEKATIGFYCEKHKRKG